MTLRELSYMILEQTRNAHIVDDERIDLRLLDKLINEKRAYILENDNSVNAHNEFLKQTMPVDMSLITSGYTPAILRSTNLIPSFIENKYGKLIDKISGENNMAYSFTIIPFERIKWCGSGYFNENVIFVAIDGKRLFINSKNEGFRLIEKIYVEGIFKDPLTVLDDSGDPQLTPTSGDYPIDGELFGVIKESIKKEDIAFMLRLPSDEVNDATGDIIVG